MLAIYHSLGGLDNVSYIIHIFDSNSEKNIHRSGYQIDIV